MFVDASALCAILLQEPDAAALADKIEGADPGCTSALAVFEAVRALMRVRRLEPDVCRAEVEALLDEADLGIAVIGLDEQRLALEAMDRFGKGRHPAALNMGDCFAYACARSLGVPLLFKGEDFARTDIEAA